MSVVVPSARILDDALALLDPLLAAVRVELLPPQKGQATGRLLVAHARPDGRAAVRLEARVLWWDGTGPEEARVPVRDARAALRDDRGALAAWAHVSGGGVVRAGQGTPRSLPQVTLPAEPSAPGAAAACLAATPQWASTPDPLPLSIERACADAKRLGIPFRLGTGPGSSAVADFELGTGPLGARLRVACRP